MANEPLQVAHVSYDYHDGQAKIVVDRDPTQQANYFKILLFSLVYDNDNEYLDAESAALSGTSGTLTIDHAIDNIGWTVAVIEYDTPDTTTHQHGDLVDVVITAVAGVHVSYDPHSLIASWTAPAPESTPDGAQLTVTLVDSDGNQAEQQVAVTTTAVAFPSPKPLSGSAHLQVQVTAEKTAGPAVTVPVATPPPPPLPPPPVIHEAPSLTGTSYDGETVEVTWDSAVPLGTASCLVEILTAGAVIATGHGTAGRGRFPADLSPAVSYTARLRWVSGTVTGPAGPEKPVIAAVSKILTVKAKISDRHGLLAFEADVTIAAPSAPLPADATYVAYLMQGERVIGYSTATSSRSITIYAVCGDLSGLTVRAQASSGGCSGPLGPPAPVLAAAPAITHASVRPSPRGSTLDVTWTRPPDAGGEVAATTIVLNGNHPYVGFTGTHVTLEDVQLRGPNQTVSAYATTNDYNGNQSPVSPEVALLTAAPAITEAVFDGQAVRARWSWRDDTANAVLATGYRLEVFSGTTRVGQALVSGLSGLVTPNAPVDPVTPLRLAVSPLAPGAEYIADPGPSLIGAAPVLTEVTTDAFGSGWINLAWQEPPAPLAPPGSGLTITRYEAVFTAQGKEEVLPLGLTSPRSFEIPPALDSLSSAQVAVRAVGTADGATVTGPSAAPVPVLREPLETWATITDKHLQVNWLPVIGDPEGYEVTLTIDQAVTTVRVNDTTAEFPLDVPPNFSYLTPAKYSVTARRGITACGPRAHPLVLQPPRVTDIHWDGSVLTATWLYAETDLYINAYELTVRDGNVTVATARIDLLPDDIRPYTVRIPLSPWATGLPVTVAAFFDKSRGVESAPIRLPAPGPAPTSVAIDSVTGKATVTWDAVTSNIVAPLAANPAPTISYLVQRYRAGQPYGLAVAATGTSLDLADNPEAYEDLEVAVAVRITVEKMTSAGNMTATGPYGPRLRVLTEPAAIRDVDFDGRAAAVSWAPVPGATGYTLTATDGVQRWNSKAASDQTAQWFTVPLGDPSLDYRVSVQPVRGASSGVPSTVPLVGDGLYVLPGPARIVRARKAPVTPQAVVAYLPDLSATGQQLTGLPIKPQPGDTQPSFVIAAAPATAAPMKYTLTIDNGALAFGGARAQLAADYRALLRNAETSGASPRGIFALQQAIARLMPQTFDETLYYSYGLSSLGGSVDLRPGMVLRVAFSSFDLAAVSGAPTWSSGYTGGPVLDYDIGDYIGHIGGDEGWLVGFDAFVDWAVTQGVLTVPAPQLPPAPGGGIAQSGGADAADLSYPLFAQPFYRLLIPHQLQGADTPANSATNQQFTIAAAAKWGEIDQATAAPGGGVHVAYFRGRAVLRACIRVTVDGAEHVVPVGTTVGNLLDRVARRPPSASLALRGVRLYRAPGPALCTPVGETFHPDQGYDAAAMTPVRLDWPAATAWPVGPRDALSLPLLHGDRIVFGAGT